MNKTIIKEQSEKIVEMLRNYGYTKAEFCIHFEELNIGPCYNRWVNLSFDERRGFYLSTTGTWITSQFEADRLANESKQMATVFRELNTELELAGFVFSEG